MKKYMIFFVLAALVACNNNETEEYSLSLQETLEQIKSNDDVLSAEKVAELLLSTDEKVKTDYVFVDIRTPYEYNVWHVPGAVNIPAKNVFSEEYDELLCNNDIVKVLYCKGSHQSMNTYLELMQSGYKNIKVSLGGYSFLKENIIDTLNLSAGIYNEDAALYDYAKVVQETAGAGSVSNTANKSKPKKKVVRRKKKEVEGGCG